MKADRGSLAANLARLDPAWRLVLFHGPDEAASRDMARQIARQFETPGNPLSLTLLAGASLRDDPASLASAAAEVSMFGDRTLVRVDDAGEEAAPAVAALLESPVSGNPVLMIASGLKKGSKLLALTENSRNALVQINYSPDARDADSLVAAMAAEVGLKPARGIGRTLFDACGGDRGVLRSELTKLALYLDATPAAPRSLETEALLAVGADSAEADLSALVSAVAGGRPDLTDVQLALLAEAGLPGIPLLRGVARRFWLLLELRALVDAGVSAQAAVKGARPPIFWKEEAAVTAQLSRWRAPAIRAVLDRLLESERAIKRSGSAGDVLATQALLGIATLGMARG